MSTLKIPVLLAALLLALPTLAAERVLSVESLIGSASSERLGVRRPLQVGDSIGEREVLRTAEDSRLSLRFASEGLLELGPDAKLAVEKLPASLQGRDLRSIASLLGGYLHVLWTAPTPAIRWPFVLYFGGQRSGLLPGEYFFERGKDGIRSCIATGQLTVTAIAGDGVETLRAGACHDLQVSGPARSQPIGSELIDAMRAEFSTRPSRDKRPLRPLVLPALDMGPLPGATPAPASKRPPIPPAPPVPSAPPAPATAVRPALPAAPAAIKPAAPVAAAGPAASGATPAIPAPAPPAARPAVPAAPVADPVPEPGDVGWTLLVGSFADPGNASQIADNLRGLGMTPFTRIKDIDGKTWHSVQVRGGFASRALAEAKAAEVRAQLRIDTVRVVYLK